MNRSFMQGSGEVKLILLFRSHGTMPFDYFQRPKSADPLTDRLCVNRCLRSFVTLLAGDLDGIIYGAIRITSPSTTSISASGQGNRPRTNWKKQTMKKFEKTKNIYSLIMKVVIADKSASCESLTGVG